MKNPYKGKSLYIRLTLLTLAIIIVGLFSTLLVRNLVIRGYQVESNQKIELYSEFIESRLTAYDRVDSLIEKAVDNEIVVIANLLLKEKDQFSDSYFENKLDEYGITSLAWVNDLGQTIAASDPIFYDYQIDENHILWDFFSSDETILIEPIRESFISEGKPYKIANFKDENGYMLQVAIEVADYNSIFDELTIQAILTDIYNSSSILYAKFIDTDYKIIAHSSQSLVNLIETEEHLIQAIDQEMTITHTHEHTLEGINAYSIAQPIYVDGVFIGLLDIGFNPDYVLPIITTVNTIVLITMGVLTLIILLVSLYGGKARSIMFEAAFLDQATGLYSKHALDYTLTQTALKQNVNNMSYILMNIDNYRALAGIHGVDRMTEVIKEVGDRLSSVYDKRYIFKVSVDEFLILCQSNNHDYILKRLSETKTLLQTDILIQEYVFNLQFTVAIIDDYKNMDYVEIYKSLSRVMREAKLTNKGGFLFYDEALIKRIDRNQTIENELKKALSQEQTTTLYPVFQPQINTTTNEVYGVEILSRLNISTYGFIPPPEFIQIAENSGIIQKLGQYVLKQAALFYHELVKAGLNPIPVSINVSTVEIKQKNFANNFLEALKNFNMPVEYVHIEITETVLASNFNHLEEQLNTLRKEGVKISIDDFGMGYSSLSYLKVAPIDFIKIDKVFIDDLNTEQEIYSLSEAVIQIAHQLGASVIAEGVETELQVNKLNLMACDFIQGYYYSKPVKLETCIEYIKSFNINK